MNYSKHQILAFTGHRDKYVKALAAIGEDFVDTIRHNLCRFLVNVYFYPTFPAATVVSDWRIAVARPKKKRLACTILHISAQCRANTVQAPCKIKDTWLP